MKITLVNNAAVEAMMHFDRTPKPASIRNVDRQIDVNLRSVIHLTESFIPHMVKSGGHVLNINSLAGKSANAFNTACVFPHSPTPMFQRCQSPCPLPSCLSPTRQSEGCAPGHPRRR